MPTRLGSVVSQAVTARVATANTWGHIETRAMQTARAKAARPPHAALPHPRRENGTARRRTRRRPRAPQAAAVGFANVSAGAAALVDTLR